MSRAFLNKSCGPNTEALLGLVREVRVFNFCVMARVQQMGIPCFDARGHRKQLCRQILTIVEGILSRLEDAAISYGTPSRAVPEVAGLLRELEVHLAQNGFLSLSNGTWYDNGFRGWSWRCRARSVTRCRTRSDFCKL